jgi:hypothetical protein
LSVDAVGADNAQFRFRRRDSKCGNAVGNVVMGKLGVLIDGEHKVGTPLEREADAGIERRRDTEIRGTANDLDAGGDSRVQQISTPLGAPIINDDDCLHLGRKRSNPPKQAIIGPESGDDGDHDRPRASLDFSHTPLSRASDRAPLRTVQWGCQQDEGDASAVTDSEGAAWTGPEAELDARQRMLALEHQLELMDRVKSLEARLAQLSVGASLTPSEQLSAEQQLLALRESLPWRVGRVVTIPVRVIGRVLRRGTRE